MGGLVLEEEVSSCTIMGFVEVSGCWVGNRCVESEECEKKWWWYIPFCLLGDLGCGLTPVCLVHYP